MLRLVAPYFNSRDWDDPPPRSARFHLAVGNAHLLTGNNESAATEFRLAVSAEPDLAEAHLALSRLEFQGTDRPD